MDNVTHALAGALLGAATLTGLQRRGAPVSDGVRRAAFTMGVVTAELPDIDILYAGNALGMGKLGYLLHHRGHTHTAVFALGAALLTWLVALALRRELRARQHAIPFLALATVGTGSHVALDFTNNYGVHPWWPWDNRWFYGDAVYILEPWLWIVALGPLFFIARTRWARGIIAALCAAILAAVWGLGMVPEGTATLITIGAVLSLLAAWRLPAVSRPWIALVAWVAVEGVFFAASRAGRREVTRAVGPTLRDAVLTPLPGNPSCLRALVLTEVEDTYSITAAAVAPWPSWRTAGDCGEDPRRSLDGAPVTRPSTAAVAWGAGWQGSARELRALAATQCEVAAALQYFRVPILRTVADGRLQLSDARYGEGTGSFASVIIGSGASGCPRFVPGWRPPRSDLLRSPE